MEVQVQHMMSDEGIAVKEEPMVFLVEDDGFGIPGVIGGGDGEMGSVPRPLEGLREIGPPPFLKKTYDMVDDPNTDPVISWTPTRASFVVWDPHRLSTDVLPKYFKHNNFSSFIRQLNTYRFRKIDSDRWEFANEGFQKGKRHLLKSIKRRKHQHHHHHHPQAMQQAGMGHKWVDSCNEAQAELCKLRNDQNLLKMEIMRLKQQQETTDNHLAMVRERLESTESRHKYIVFFVVKAFRNPFFIQHLTEKMRQRTAINGGARVAKKRRLVAPESSTNAAAAADGKNLRGQEELVMLHSEIQTLFSSDDSSSPVQDQKVKTPAAAANSPEMNSENFILWEKLVEDDMIYENETEVETAKHQSAIVHELEDLIARPPEWGY